MPPDPRPAVAAPDLTRPDWTRAENRDPTKLWLDKNENGDLELAAVVREVVAGLPHEVFWTYPDVAPLYHRLAEYTGVAADRLLLANGSDGAIRAVFEAFVSPGDRVLHTAPTFAMYFVYSKMYGANEVLLHYRRTGDGPVLEADKVADAILEHRPRVACMPNPDSPTGTVFGQDDMRTIIEAAGEAGSLMLVDEAYHPFHDETVLPWVDRYPHLVVTRSTGKAWGMAGFRIGYAAASSEVAKMLHKVRPMYETGAVSIAVFREMLERADVMRASVLRLETGKRYFLDAMEALGFRVLRGKGNFLHVAFGEHAEAVHAALRDRVYYRKDFREPCLKGYSRFSVTTVERFAPIIDLIAGAKRT